MRFLIVVLGVLLGVVPANAGVTYNWVNLTPTVTGFEFAGSITITNETFLSRSTAHFESNWDTYASCPHSLIDGGIENFQFGAVGGDAPYYYGSAFELYDTFLCQGRDAGYFTKLELTPFGNKLSGLIDIYAQTTEVYLNGDSIWTITDIGSDFGGHYGGCATTHSCGNPTGYWVLDPKSLRGLPTPPAYWLLLMGLLGLATFRLSCKARRQDIPC